MAVNEKKERPLSTMSEASHYSGTWDYAAHPGSSPGRPSRPSKKVHNFGKRSNSIRRNPSAPVIKRNWLYKQDSTGMKLWKKRWFVLSDMCLFYYRDEKEEGILGSILLPSFHVSMLSVDDHVNRKFAFKATHPNMRTYYFCTDTTSEMDSWVKVMTEAALVQAEPVKRLDKEEIQQCEPQDHVTNHHRQQPTETENKNNEAKDKCISPTPPTTTEEERKQGANHYVSQKDTSEQDCPLTKVNSLKLQGKSIKSDGTSPLVSSETDSPQVNGSLARPTNGTCGPPQQSPAQEADRNLSRTNSMQQLEQWVRTQRGRNQDEDTRSVSSYQTLPRNSHWFPVIPQYEDGYRSIPRNTMGQRGSICSLSPSLYEQTLGPLMADKRRSMRDDTLWQLYEWQQRQAYNRQPVHYSRMASPQTIINLSEHAPMSYSIPPSPSHGSLSMYSAYSPMRSYNMGNTRSEVSSPVYRQDMSIDRRLRPPVNKYAYPPDRRSMPAGIPMQTIPPQSLQSKTINPENYRLRPCSYFLEDLDVDIKLSRLCEQDKLVKIQNDKVQQLYREKHTLETALLSASQEIEMGSDNPAALHSVIQQRDLLQSGLLSTCRELSKVTTELEQASMEYDRIEGEVTLAKNILLEHMEALGSPQTEPPSQQHVRIQKELWQIQDVLEGLNKHKAQRNAVGGPSFHGSKDEDCVPPRPPLPQSYQPDTPSVPPLPDARHSSLYRPEDRGVNNPRNHTHSGPDYRLYKSEPELTTVTEVDENNGEERPEHPSDREHSSNKGMSYPVGIVPPRTKSPVTESSSVVSYVTLRNSRKTDPRVDRPHSAVEPQLCSVESGRPRMSVEEQLERIRRHQQGALKGKKKSMVSRNGSQDKPVSRSHSFTKESSFRNMQFQVRRRGELMSTDIHQLEKSLRQQEGGREIETPSEEITRLKDVAHSDHFNVDRELSVPDKVLIPERYIESDPEEPPSPEQVADKQRKVDRIKALIAKNSVQNMVPSTTLSPEEDGEGDVMVQEKEKMINISYELAAEASKRSKLVAAQALASVKSYM